MNRRGVDDLRQSMVTRGCGDDAGPESRRPLATSTTRGVTPSTADGADRRGEGSELRVPANLNGGEH